MGEGGQVWEVEVGEAHCGLRRGRNRLIIIKRVAETSIERPLGITLELLFFKLSWDLCCAFLSVLLIDSLLGIEDATPCDLEMT